MRSRGLAGSAVAVAVCLSALGATAGPALAATTIGSDLSATPSAVTLVSATFVNTTQRTVDPTPLAAPTAGVLVRLRIRHGATGPAPGTYAYRIMSGTAPDYTARPATACGSDQPIGFLTNAPAGTDTYIPTDFDGRPRGVPIAAGERLAVWLNPGAAAPATIVSGAGAQLDHFTGNHASGTQTYTALGGFSFLVQGLIEPDADGDGFGDESQDTNPSVADPASCTAPVQTVVEPGPVQTVVEPGPVQTVIQPGPTESPPTFGSQLNVSLKLDATRIKPGKKFSVTLENTNPFEVKGLLAIVTRDKYEVTISKRQRVTLATKSLNLKAGGSQSFRVGLPSALTKRFKRQGKFGLSFKATLRDPAGVEHTLKANRTLKKK